MAHTEKGKVLTVLSNLDVNIDPANVEKGKVLTVLSKLDLNIDPANVEGCH